MEKIKLVIWDLDDTFWEGTLSEGTIKLDQSKVEIIRELTDRGIMNSICSKNDFENVKQVLKANNIWNHFVFPKINWNAKGEQIKWIIDSMQLRPINVLFIDDNHINLKEAEHYNPNINTKSPDFIDNILNHPAFKGKDDLIHSRLRQYKILEKKAIEKTKFQSNIEFLRSNKIQISIKPTTLDEVERVHELIDRSNQLNFTKIRSTKEVLKVNIERNDSHSIYLSDKYGDYGLVGFVCLINNQATHFVFSCRIMNLGVEQYLYKYFNKPQLCIKGEVASDLNLYTNQEIDWIINKTYKEETKSSTKKRTVLFKGGCDLSQMLHFLKAYKIDVIEETNFVENGVPIHAEHTDILLSKYNPKYSWIKILPESAFQTKIFDGKYDILVYSTLMDYTQYVYADEDDYKVPYGGYENTISNSQKFDDIFKKRFTNVFKKSQLISPDRFYDNLKAIRSKIPSHVPIIFLNGVELKSPIPQEKNALERHKLMNKKLSLFVERNENVFLCDLTKIVKSNNELTDNIRHYIPEVYMKISDYIVEIISNITNQEVKKSYGKSIEREFIGVLRNIKRAITK